MQTKPTNLFSEGDLIINEDEGNVGLILHKSYKTISDFSLKKDKYIEEWDYNIRWSGMKKISTMRETTLQNLIEKGIWSIQRVS